MIEETQSLETVPPPDDTAPATAFAVEPAAKAAADDVPPMGPIPADELLFSMTESQAVYLYRDHGLSGAQSHDEVIEMLQAKRDADTVPQPIEITQVGDDGFYAVNPWPHVALLDKTVFDGRTIRREGAMVIFSLDNGTAAYVLRDLAVPAAGAADLQPGSVYRPDMLDEAKAIASLTLSGAGGAYENATPVGELTCPAVAEEAEALASEAVSEVNKVWNIHLQAWV